MQRTLEYINDAAGNPVKFINDCTEEYLEEIKSVAKKVTANKKIKFVAIAGPSASGKTTTAHILMRELEKLGRSIIVISLDDFYKRTEDLPILPDGSYDMETVDSIDAELIKKHFSEMLTLGKTRLPKYDFTTNTRDENGSTVELKENSIVIIEGLHALNPKISEALPAEHLYKIYICLDKSVEDNDGRQILTSRQIRLARRVIRDEKFRGADIKDTLAMWNNVLEGEVKYLFPFKDTADSKIRTMQPFEVCVYKESFCKLRSGVTRNTPWYEYFIDTVNTFEQFKAIDPTLVPDGSLIKEFIG